jgi:YjbE family integral membrane protein
MDIMSAEFWTALLSIIFIDLILAGDNAIVIGMAARRLSGHQQKKAILWGTAGAVAIRIIATMVVVELLKLPGLQLVGGLLLCWIAFKLLMGEEDHKEVKAKDSLLAAVWTIVIADAAMGLDNVIAVAGAAQGHIVLVIIGLLVSVPIVVWGSTLFIKLINRFPSIIYFGSGILAYTAAKMITHEKLLHGIFAEPAVRWIFMAIVIVAILAAGRFLNMRRADAAQRRIESGTNV